jgi:hypothetical protein
MGLLSKALESRPLINLQRENEKFCFVREGD